MKITRAHRLYVLLMLLLLTVLAACSMLGPEDATNTPDATEEPDETGGTAGEVTIDNIEILMLESFPVQVNVVASGQLPDGCTSLNDPQPRLEGNTFVVNLTTTRLDEACTQALVPFDKVIPLPVEGLSAGTYTVAVNGITDTFTLDVDNVAEGEQTPTAESGAEPSETAEGTAGEVTGISGRVWHDLCAVAGGEGGEAAVPSDGCVALEDGEDAFRANGILEAEEPGIEGVTVTLAEGACPGTELMSTTTDADGAFTFSDLDPGTYCVSVDSLADVNTSILIPGDWTSPEPAENTGAAVAEVDVSAGTPSEDIDFGWDYQFLPEAPGTAGASKDCSDAATFLADVTVQDNEILPPGFGFTKTWQLQNGGSCAWGTDYSAAIAFGDQLGAPGEVALTEEVTPTGSIQISVPMVAPTVNGTYRSDWVLRNELGEDFGVPGPFYVQIVVTSAIPADGAYINGVVWSDECTVPSGDVTDPPLGCVALDDGGFAADGVYDVGEARIPGVTVAIAEGACPATTVLTTTTTDRQGRYIFRQLDPGTYCVFIDAQADQNESVLSEGQWTWPEVSDEPVGITITVEENGTVSDAYFGWDFAAD